MTDMYKHYLRGEKCGPWVMAARRARRGLA